MGSLQTKWSTTMNIAKLAAKFGCIVILGTVFQADAKPVPPGGDSFQIGCRSLQSRAESLLAEYKQLGNSLPSHPENGARMREIVNELRNLGGDWRSIGCQSAWGDMVRRIPSPPRPGQPVRPAPPKREVAPR
jgi:hypothetical protein